MVRTKELLVDMEKRLTQILHLEAMQQSMFKQVVILYIQQNTHYL